MLEAKQNIENEELIDMKSIPINERPNIGVQDMDKYKNGGLTVESLEENGALIYIPYGIYVRLFNAIDTGIYSIEKKITDSEKFKKKMSEWNDKEFSKKFEKGEDVLIDILKKDMNLLKTIYPLKNEV